MIESDLGDGVGHVFQKAQFSNRIILRLGTQNADSTAIDGKKSYDYTIQKMVFRKDIAHTAVTCKS